MPDLIDVVARWEMFLANLHERFAAVLGEAQTGCAQLLREGNHDTTAMSVAWGAIELRAKQLSSKLFDTWSDKVGPMFDALDLDPEVEERERAKATTLGDRMEIELEGTRIRIFADAARTVWQRAVDEAPVHLACTQCGAPLPVPQTLSAINVGCPHCSAVVTYEPGTRLRSIEHFCLHPLAEESAWSQWLARHRAERALHESRHETIALLQAYERTQIEYWRVYLTTRAQLSPSHAAAFDKDLRGRMQHWYDQVERSGAWIAAGRPRALR